MEQINPLFCQICNQPLKTERTYKEHLKSHKHLKNLEKVKELCCKDDDVPIFAKVSHQTVEEQPREETPKEQPQQQQQQQEEEEPKKLINPPLISYFS